MTVTGTGEGLGTDGKMGGSKSKGRKGGGATDQLVEMRFYVPGTATTRVAKEGGEDGELESDDENAEVEEQNAATLFHDTLADKAEIGAVAGDTYATFLDVLHLTPRYVTVWVATWYNLTETIGVDSIWTCTKLPLGCEGKHTTTRLHTIR